MKFGGTSVRDAAAIRAAAALVIAAAGRRPAVVVSAAAGVTDSLVRIVTAAVLPAAERRVDLAQELQELRRRHEAIAADLAVAADIDGPLAQLGDLVRGLELLGEATRRTRDLCLSFGEILLSRIFAAYLEQQGQPSTAWVAGDLGLLTDDRFGRARPLPESFELIAAKLSECTMIPVITGFVGATRDGRRTTLGRGGSDYSASLVARAVGAEELQIWTDVDGIMTADPRVVADARCIQQLSFGEASELAYSGARVLHPFTISPAMEAGIPVRVLNTTAPERAGTTILGTPGSGQSNLRSIAHKTGVQVITVVSPRMLDRHGFVSRIAAAFDRSHISIDMISTSEVSVSLTTDEPIGELDDTIEELQSFAEEVVVEGGRGMVSVVGVGLGENSDLVGKILGTVAEKAADIEMVSYGATRLNLAVLIPEASVEPVVKHLHNEYFQ
ncbi:MAG: aspartate kinase [Planctomycetota bacterium]